MDKIYLPKVKLDIAGQQFKVLALKGTETKSMPYCFIMDLLLDDDIDFIMTPAILRLVDRSVAGIITASYGKKLILEPRLVLARLSKTIRVILDQSVPDIVQEILLACGYEKEQIKFHLNKNYLPISYRMQTQNETDFDFMMRLLGKAGIHYWFETDGQQGIIHLGDTNNSSQQIKMSSNHPQTRCNYIANIESTGEYAQLDQQGSYRLRQKFDLADTPNASATPPITKLAPYSGWHQPLQQQAEVLVDILDGDPDQPIILGTIPNTDKTSPVKDLNKQQNIMRTASNNLLLMDDTKDKQRIQLGTYSGHNLLDLNADKNDPQVNLITHEGSIKSEAKQNIKIQSDATITKNINKDHIYIVEQNYQIKTQDQDIHYQAATGHDISAQKDIHHEAAENIEHTNDNTSFTSESDTKFITTGNILITTKQNIFFQAAQNITLTGNNNIEFRKNNFGCQITNNTINLSGNILSLSANAGVALHGQVNCNFTLSLASAFASLPNALSAQTIPELNTPNIKSGKKSDVENYKFNDEYMDQFNLYLQMFNNLEWLVYDQSGGKRKAQYQNNEIKLPNNIDHTDTVDLLVAGNKA